MMNIKENFKELAAIILNPESSYGDIKNAIDALYLLFTEAGAYKIDTEMPMDSQGTFLRAGGLAVSISTAAKCLFDIARIRAFAAGLLQAVKSYKKADKPVQILYAGCGPYALLAVLIIPFLNDKEVEFTLLDIHEEALHSAMVLINALNYEGFFTNISKADATKYIWQKDDTIDIAVAECLQNALKKETQVSVAVNLAPQLGDDGILIPESIEVNAVLVHLSKRHAVRIGKALHSSDEVYHNLGNVVNLNKETAIAAANNIVNPFPKQRMQLPKEFLVDPYSLELHTIIHVFNNVILSENESSLTVPLKLANADTLIDKTEIEFNYINDEKPGIRWSTN